MGSQAFGIPDRDFPFRGTNDLENQLVEREINRVLMLIEGMMKDLIGRQAQALLEWEEFEDVFQQLSVHLATQSLPRFDLTRRSNSGSGHPLSLISYINICIRRWVMMKMRKINRMNPDKKRFMNPRSLSLPARGDPNSLVMVFGGASEADCSHDNKIELISDAVHTNPEKFFSTEEVKVFQICSSNPQLNKSELARLCGYSRPQKFYRVFERMSARMLEILHDERTHTHLTTQCSR